MSISNNHIQRSDVTERENILCALELQLADAMILISDDNLPNNEVAATKLLAEDLMSMINLEKSFIKALEFQLSVKEVVTLSRTFETMRIQEQTDEDYARRLANLPPKERPARALETLDDVSPGQLVNRYIEIPDDEAQSLLDIVRAKQKFFGKVPSSDEMADVAGSDDLASTVSITLAKDSCSVSGLRKASSKVKSELPYITEHPEQCYACLDLFNKTVSFPCGHRACRECLSNLCAAAVKDRALIPIKCCGLEIDQNCADFVLSDSQLIVFHQIVREVTTEKKCYCTNSRCSLFIDISLMESLGEIEESGSFLCPACEFPLCANCITGHPNQSCAEFKQTQSAVSNSDNRFLELVRAEGYSQCSRCHVYVELTVGCNHMTCACGHQFCHVCNAQWKTCVCAQWDENRLLDRARERAGDQAHIPEAVDRQRARILIEEECHHTNKFERINRGHYPGCNSCGFQLFLYHYKCSACNTRVCYTCRFHRLTLNLATTF